MNENQNPVKLLNGQYVLLTLINFVVSVSYSMVSTIMAKYLGSIGLSIAVAGAITGAFPLPPWLRGLLQASSMTG